MGKSEEEPFDYFRYKKDAEYREQWLDKHNKQYASDPDYRARWDSAEQSLESEFGQPPKTLKDIYFAIESVEHTIQENTSELRELKSALEVIIVRGLKQATAMVASTIKEVFYVVLLILFFLIFAFSREC